MVNSFSNSPANLLGKNIEKHMENGYHLASLTTVALCHCLLKVCVCVTDFGAAFCLKEFEDN